VLFNVCHLVNRDRFVVGVRIEDIEVCQIFFNCLLYPFGGARSPPKRIGFGAKRKVSYYSTVVLVLYMLDASWCNLYILVFKTTRSVQLI
ncbi:MAG: hypothetical protein ACI8RD_012175, partial [Bacillariaceae sp.]|jgi:hypothetical protein